MSDERLIRIEDKIDKVNDRLTSIHTELATQAIVVKQHEQRSTNLEAIVHPMKERMDETKGAIKLLKTLALIIGMLESLHAIHWWFQK